MIFLNLSIPLKIFFLLCIFFSQVAAENDSLSLSTQENDTIRIRAINFHIQNNTQSYVLKNTIRYREGELYSQKRTDDELRRLYEQRIFNDIVSVTEIDGGYADISYFVHDRVFVGFSPSVHLDGIPDSGITLTAISGRLTVKNIFGHNETYDIFGRMLSPFSLAGTNFVFGHDFYSYRLAASLYSESLTRWPLILGLHGNYMNISSPRVRHLDEEKVSGAVIIGKKTGRFQEIKSFIGGSSKTVTIDTTGAVYYSVKYPYAVVEWDFTEVDFEYFPGHKNSVYARANKVGLSSSPVDFFLFEAGASVIRSPLFLRTMLKVNHRSILFANRLFSNQYLFAGGSSSNRGYSFNSLPRVSQAQNQEPRTGMMVNNLQSEVAFPFFKFGPFQNFFLNYATTQVELAIWADFTHTRDKQREDQFYYSYGVGLRGWVVNFFQFGAISLSNNRENEIKILFSNTFVF